MEKATPDPETIINEETPKSARVEFRSTPIQKSIIERAASLLGESVTSFVLSTALRDAIKVIHDYQVSELSVRDWAQFEKILEEREAPSKALVNALNRYRREVSSSDGF